MDEIDCAEVNLNVLLSTCCLRGAAAAAAAVLLLISIDWRDTELKI